MSTVRSPSPYRSIRKSSRQIRLVILEPAANPHDAIQCKLLRSSLDAGCYPDFEALSYEWGQEGDNSYIFIDGILTTARRNLWDALYHLRYSHSERIFWIDAICINQDNLAERNHQVRQMRSIYETSSKVIIWLGLSSSDSMLALDFITYVSQNRRRGDLRRWLGFSKELDAVRNLCRRSYWTRLWIVQEVLVADKAEIQCGMDFTKWESFGEFQNVCKFGDLRHEVHSRYADLLSSPAFKLDCHLVKYRSTSLRVLLEAFPGCLCSEIKDKVYGLAGVADDTSALNIDYSKSVFHIFQDVIMIQMYKDCALLVQFSQFLQRLLAGRVASSISLRAYQSTHFAGAIGYSGGKISYLGPYYKRRSALENSGNLVSRFVEELRYGNLEVAEDVATLLSPAVQPWIEEDVKSIHSSLSYGLWGGMEFGKYKRSRFPSNHRSAGEFVESQTPIQPWGQLMGHLRPVRFRLAHRAAQEYENAEPRLFVDDRGFVGVAPSNIRRGDQICRFRNCDIVALLRWQFDRYFFVGRAVFPKTKGEPKVPLFNGSREHFVFNVPTKYELGETISLYINTHTLQMLT